MAQVRVHDAEDLAARGREAVDDGGAEPQLARPVHDADAVPRRQIVGQRAGAVRRTVVDDHQLAVDAVRGEHLEDRLDQLTETGALVVGRHDDGEAHAPTLYWAAVTAEPASAAPGRQSPSRRWAVWLAIAVLAALLRGLYPTADPPWRATVGVVWHDEGAWTHNARNRALWGTWRTDDWNPLYVAPVFTGLEYAAFATFGVGTWQARLVPMTLGVIAVVALGCGVARIGGRRAGIAAGVLLATNYVGAMYDRAAIMEGPMAAAIVVSWWAFARAQERPAWGAVAGVAAIAAYFIKAAAVFFVGAIGLTALVAIALPGLPAIGPAIAPAAPRDCGRWPAWPSPASSRWRSSSGRNGASTASTTGRCRSRASRPTTRSRC